MYNRLQYISQGATPVKQLENIKQALDAGCKWVQFRYKHADENEFAAVAEQAKDLCANYKATFIVNDNVALAYKIDADGVHLGLHDMPVSLARNIMGKDKIIGGTANTLTDVMKRVHEKCNYIGLGPFRFTETKEKLSPVLGLDGYKEIIHVLSEKRIEVPVYAIGGIVTSDIVPLVNTGIYGIAISGAITNEPQKKELIQEINSLLNWKS